MVDPILLQVQLCYFTLPLAQDGKADALLWVFSWPLQESKSTCAILPQKFFYMGHKF